MPQIWKVVISWIERAHPGHISIKENGLKVQHIITKETKKKKKRKTLTVLERGKKIKLHAKDQESEWHSIFQKQ